MGLEGIGFFVALFAGLFGAAAPILWPEHRQVGYVLFYCGIMSMVVAAFGGLTWGWPMFAEWWSRVGPGKFLLLTGIVGTWLFLTIGASAALWLLTRRTMAPTIGAPVAATPDSGPLSWLPGFVAMEGGSNGQNVFSLRFQGANISKAPARLKSATVTSLIDGTQETLEIVANDADGNSQIVSLDQVQLIPPGAPIELVAKFGPPDPARTGFVKGLDPKAFLEKWRQFAFDAADEGRTYRFEVNENAFMPYFKGKVGPRVALKPR
jgi:hypothetical protein